MAVVLVALSLSVAGIATHAGWGDKDGFWRALIDDIEPAAVPAGYAFDFGQPIVRGDEDIYQGVVARGEIRFNRLPDKDRPPLASGWEGFQYYVFDDAAAAERFSLTEPDAVENLKNLLGYDKEQDRFDPKARRVLTRLRVEISGASSVELRCMTADELIGCLAHPDNATAVIHLMVQEPELRDAAGEAERRARLEARARKEASGLLKTAVDHLAKAERKLKK